MCYESANGDFEREAEMKRADVAIASETRGRVDEMRCDETRGTLSRWDSEEIILLVNKETLYKMEKMTTTTQDI